MIQEDEAPLETGEMHRASSYAPGWAGPRFALLLTGVQQVVLHELASHDSFGSARGCHHNVQASLSQERAIDTRNLLPNATDSLRKARPERTGKEGERTL